jgi:hypothetical protein
MKAALVIVAVIVAASFGWVAYTHAVSGMQHAIATQAARVSA